jgi:hypothetical protein
MKRAFFVFISMFYFALPAFAVAPVCLYQDILSGPATGGEGGNGIYLDIFGTNFGATQGTSTVTVNGTAVAQYIYWGADATGDRQQIGVQIAKTTTGTGNVVVTTSAGSTTCPSTFTVRSGNIYYIGPGIDNDTPGTSCSALKNGTAGNGSGGSGTYASPWKLTNAVNISMYANAAISNGGTGYATVGTYSTTSSGSGTGMTASVDTYSGQTVLGSFTTIAPGSGYALGDLIYLTGATGTGAVIVVTGIHQNAYTSSTARTPRTYYECLSAGDTLVFLNGVSFLYGDGTGNYSSFVLDRNISTSSSFFTFMARPGASVQLGSQGGESIGIRDEYDTYTVISGLTVAGSSQSGTGINIGGEGGAPYIRLVGNTVTCPDCAGESAAIAGGIESDTTVGLEILGNYITNVSCEAVVNGGYAIAGRANKQYHDLYFEGNGIEVGWNKVGSSCGFNGLQINFAADNGIGFGNLSIHDNDIATANGSGINLSSIDPAQGPINVYNNIIHNVGTQSASDSNGFHSCIAFPGEAPSAGAGTVNVYNNTMYDCASRLNAAADTGACAVVTDYEAGQTGLTINLVNNIIAQPSYTYTGSVNPYVCHSDWNSPYPTITGSNNIFYSGGTPGSTSPASSLTSLTVPTNPLFNSTTTPGPWAYLELQTTSPAIGAGSASLYPTLDFNGVTRPYSPAIGAMEHGSTSSEEQITVSAAPNPATLEQPVTLTAMVAQTGSSVPTGSINFLNGSVSFGQASLDSEGTATLVLSWLSVGSYEVVAAYSGDSKYPSGKSGVALLQVMSATTTSLVASPNPATAGQALALTATVEGEGATSPSGTVSILNGSTLLGTAALDASGVATLSTASLATGTYSLTVQYSGNASFLSSTSAAVPVTVTVNASTTTTSTSLVASPNPVTVGQALALTATVSGSGTSTPAGTVSFLNGSTPLGTATLNASGVATLSTASLAAGTYSLTAQYTGSNSFLSGTSAAVSVTVNAQATTIVQSFNLNVGGSTSQTVQPGETAVYTLGVSPAAGTTLPTINFVVSGLPAGATATFSPQTIPAGNGATNVTMSIQTSVQSAMLERNRKLGGGLVVALGILLLPFGSGIRRSGKRMLRLPYLVILLAGAVSLAGLTGCAVLNVPGEFSSASAQTYTITVTSTAASLSHTTTVTLIVE